MTIFLKSFQAKYGPAAVRPNMHLHKHIPEQRVLFGPAPATWWDDQIGVAK